MKSLRVLVVCTANACRSPVVEQLLQRRLDSFGIPATIRSAGTNAGPTPVHRDTLDAARELGLDLGQHRPRLLTAENIANDGADLIVPMTRDHLYRVVELVPDALDRTFTLIELARRAGETGPNPLTTDVAGWLRAFGIGRSPGSIAADGRAYDVLDPYGRPRRFHAKMIEEVSALVDGAVPVLAASIDRQTP